MKQICIAALCILTALCAQPLSAAQNTKPPLKVGLVTGMSGKDDSSFTLMQQAGLAIAHAKHNIEYKVLSPAQVSDQEPLLQQLAEQKFDMVIAGEGYNMKDPVNKLASQFPDTHFVILDHPAASYPDNVTSITFRQNEASYLAGALAAYASPDAPLGFLGASSFPIINDFRIGFEAGAKRINPNAQFIVTYLGQPSEEFNPFNSPGKAAQLAKNMYDSGVQVIFAVAANSNQGVFDVAKETRKQVIGVDSDQDAKVPGQVLTSVMKRLDIAVLFAVEKMLAGALKNRNYSLGLKENGVSLTPMIYTGALFSDLKLRQLKVLRHEISTGRTEVPTAMNE